jgi:hypothetical protein
LIRLNSRLGAVRYAFACPHHESEIGRHGSAADADRVKERT